MKSIKVLMISKSPLYNDSRVIKEATSLVKNGYYVTVLFITNIVKNQNYVFQIRRLNKPPASRFIFTKFFFHFLKLIQILLIGVKLGPDICHAHDLNSLPESFLISCICRAKLVYDSHELFYETAYGRRILLRFWRKIERLLGKRIDAIITVSDPILRKILSNIGLNKKSVIIKNTVEKSKIDILNKSFKNIFHEKFPETREKIILLAQGQITKYKFDEAVLDAINNILDVVLIILGNVDENYKNEFLSKIQDGIKKKKVYYLNAVDRDLLFKYTCSADIGLVLIRNICLNYYYSLPNRFFEFLSCGLPILSTNMHELKKLIKEFKLGEVYNYGSIEDFTNNLKKIIRNYNIYHSNSKQAFEKFLNWEQDEIRLINLYKSLK